MTLQEQEVTSPAHPDKCSLAWTGGINDWSGPQKSCYQRTEFVYYPRELLGSIPVQGCVIAASCGLRFRQMR